MVSPPVTSGASSFPLYLLAQLVIGRWRPSRHSRRGMRSADQGALKRRVIDYRSVSLSHPRPGKLITLRQKARVIKKTREMREVG